MLWWIDLHFTVLLIDYTMYNYIGYAVDWSPQCCHIDCRIIVTTSVSSLHQTALPTRPSLSPRVYNMQLSPSFIRQRYTVAAKQRARLRRMAQTTTSIWWTHIVRYLWLSRLIQLIRLCRTVWVTDWQQPSPPQSITSFVKGIPSPQNRGHDCEEWHKRPPVLDAHICGVSGQAVATKYLTCRWLNRHNLSTSPRGVRFHLGVNFFPIQFYVGTRGLLSYVSKPILPISALQSTEMALVATQ